MTDAFDWLEQDDPRLREWRDAQRRLTADALAALPGSLDAVRDAIRSARDFGWFGIPLGRCGRWYFHARLPGEERTTVHVGTSAVDPGRPLLTPDRFDDARGRASFGAIYPAPDGRHLIVTVFRGGNEAVELVLVDVDGAIRDRLDTPSAAFAVWHDDRSYFWSRQVDGAGALFLRDIDGGERRLDAPKDAERLVPITSDDLRWLLLLHYAPDQDGPRLFVTANSATPVFNEIVGLDLRDIRLGWWTPRGPLLVVRGGDGIRRVVETDLTGGTPVLRHLHTDDTGSLATAMASPGGDILLFLRAPGGGDRLRHLAADGTITEVPAEPGTSIKATTIDRDTGAMLASVHSWRRTQRLMSYDFQTRKFTVLRPSASSLDVEVEVVQVPARDGTPVPVTLIRPSHLAGASDLPCLLIAYGAFGSRLEPWCLTIFKPWFDAGGMVAHAHVRGGGEGGPDWHEAARGAERKLTSFTDLEAACDGLEAAGHTRRDRLCLYGVGAGGLLVLGAMARRPDLCAAVVADNPLADMANFHRWGNGAYWVREFGDPATELEAILRWSPLHTLRPGAAYPPTLVLAPSSYDGIDPTHGRKMVAALQATGGNGPYLLWDEGDAATLEGQTLEWAAVQAFAAAAVGLELTPPVRAV